MIMDPQVLTTGIVDTGVELFNYLIQYTKLKLFYCKDTKQRILCNNLTVRHHLDDGLTIASRCWLRILQLRSKSYFLLLRLRIVGPV